VGFCSGILQWDFVVGAISWSVVRFRDFRMRCDFAISWGAVLKLWSGNVVECANCGVGISWSAQIVEWSESLHRPPSFALLRAGKTPELGARPTSQDSTGNSEVSNRMASAEFHRPRKAPHIHHAVRITVVRKVSNSVPCALCPLLRRDIPGPSTSQRAGSPATASRIRRRRLISTAYMHANLCPQGLSRDSMLDSVVQPGPRSAD
jgi:hypothetical protein